MLICVRLSLFDIDMNSPIQFSFLLQLIEFSRSFSFLRNILFCSRCRIRANPSWDPVHIANKHNFSNIWNIHLRSKFSVIQPDKAREKVYWSKSIWYTMLNWRHFIDRMWKLWMCNTHCVCICFIPKWQKTFLNPSTFQHLQHLRRKEEKKTTNEVSLRSHFSTLTEKIFKMEFENYVLQIRKTTANSKRSKTAFNWNKGIHCTIGIYYSGM